MHSKYRDITQRLSIMGDYAEKQYELFCEREGIVQIPWGFHHPPFNYFPQLPSILRAAPDYLCETSANRFVGMIPNLDRQKRMPPRHFFCEVKGCGKDQTFKLKDETLDCLVIWQEVTERPVMLFLYNQAEETISFSVSLDMVIAELPSLSKGYFVDRGKEKPFYKLPASNSIIIWEEACEQGGSSTSMGASYRH